MAGGRGQRARVAGAGPAREDRRGAGVQASARGRRQPVEQGVLDERVGERPRFAAGGGQAGGRRGVEGVERNERLDAGDLGGQLGVDRASEQRRRVQHGERAGTQAGRAGGHGVDDARRRALGTVGEQRLEEERVAVGAAKQRVDVRARGAAVGRQRGHLRSPEPAQVEPDERERPPELVERGAHRRRRRRARGGEDEQRTAARAAQPHEQAQCLLVGPLEVVGDEQQRRARRGALERLDQRVPARQASRTRVGARERGLQGWGALRGRQGVEDGGERLRRLFVGHRGEHGGACGVHLGGERGHQARLADPRRAGDERRPPAAGAHVLPASAQPLERIRAPDESSREARARQRRGEGGAPGRPAGAGAERFDGQLGAQPGRQLARGHGRSDRQLGTQARGEALVLRERPSRVARGHEVTHQRPVGRLVERVERRAPAREPDGVAVVRARRGSVRERAERSAAPLAVLLARTQRPLVLQAGEQVAVAERQRVLRAPGGEQRAKRERVDLDVRREPDAVAVGAQRVGARPECGAQARERGAQARPGAAVEHVRPERGRDVGARVAPRVQCQPRQQRAHGSRRGRRKRDPADLQAERPEQVDRSTGPGFTGARPYLLRSALVASSITSSERSVQRLDHPRTTRSRCL